MKIKMKDGSIREAGFEEDLGRDAFRHTTAHILAQAVKRLYPDTKCAIGPSIADGFYYDFDFTFHFSEENFPEYRSGNEENRERKSAAEAFYHEP